MFPAYRKKYPEYFFVIKFISLFLLFYLCAEFMIGITSPGNYYSPAIDKYFNIIKWYRITILKASEKLCNLLGYSAKMLTSFKLEGYNGFRVNMVYSCIGYGIISFWAAFIISYKSRVKRKIKWLAGGVFALWLMNVIRVSLLLIIINKHKNAKAFASHHLAYNIVTYIIIIVLVYLFANESKEISGDSV